MNTLKKSTILFVLFFISTGFMACSVRPKLLPNDKLLSAGKDQSEKDIAECMELADTYADDAARWKEVAGSTGKSAIIGAGAGAVGGAIVHNAGRGTAIGAASGAVAALLSELFKSGESDPTYQSFANFCLSKKGYEVAGWK